MACKRVVVVLVAADGGGGDDGDLGVRNQVRYLFLLFSMHSSFCEIIDEEEEVEEEEEVDKSF